MSDKQKRIEEKIDQITDRKLLRLLNKAWWKEEFMTCFILFESSPWSSHVVLGVYDTEELAEGAKKAHKDSGMGHRSLYAIMPCERNAAPASIHPIYPERK